MREGGKGGGLLMILGDTLRRAGIERCYYSQHTKNNPIFEKVVAVMISNLSLFTLPHITNRQKDTKIRVYVTLYYSPSILLKYHNLPVYPPLPPPSLFEPLKKT